MAIRSWAIGFNSAFNSAGESHSTFITEGDGKLFMFLPSSACR